MINLRCDRGEITKIICLVSSISTTTMKHLITRVLHSNASDSVDKIYSASFFFFFLFI